MKQILTIFAYILFLFNTLPSVAQTTITYEKTSTKNAVLYEKAEWNIQINAQFQHPYDSKKITLDMVLTAPDGMPLILPCFFDHNDTSSSSSIWKARFAPRQIGGYSYFFQLTINGKSIQTKANTFSSIASKKKGFLHKNNLWTFRFDNGELFRGIGENVGWESRSYENSKWTYDYLLPKLADNGAQFFRTWMCPWNLPLEWQKVNNTKRYSNTTDYFNPGGIKRMDQLVNLCDSLGLYFMLTLDMNSGNWKNNPYNQLNGGPIKTLRDFFTSQKAMEKYKNKLRYVVARWGYSTSIAAWEFFNEIDNGAFTPQDSIIIPHVAITQWHMEMSRYLKDIDPYNHLVTTSISHRDIQGLNSIAYIDFNQKHIYKHTEKIPDIYADYIKTFGKPYVIGEFGYRWEDADPRYAKQADYDFKRGLWYGLFNPTPILPMSWWWEFFDEQNMTPYFRGLAKINNLMLKAGDGSFKIVDVLATPLQALSVKCGQTYFVYLLNNTDNKLTRDIQLKAPKNDYLITCFDPGTLNSSELKTTTSKNGTLTIKNISLESQKEKILIIKQYDLRR